MLQALFCEGKRATPLPPDMSLNVAALTGARTLP